MVQASSGRISNGIRLVIFDPSQVDLSLVQFFFWRVSRVATSKRDQGLIGGEHGTGYVSSENT